MFGGIEIETTLIFAAIFGVLHVFFTMRVGSYRLSRKISLGDGGDSELQKRIRAHGNFVEQVPMGLILLLLNELNGLASQYLCALGSVFLVARVLHYASIVMRLPFAVRPVAMVSTLGVILVSAILLLV